MVRGFLISKLEELLRLAKFLPSCGQLDHAPVPEWGRTLMAGSGFTGPRLL